MLRSSLSGSKWKPVDGFWSDEFAVVSDAAGSAACPVAAHGTANARATMMNCNRDHHTERWDSRERVVKRARAYKATPCVGPENVSGISCSARNGPQM